MPGIFVGYTFSESAFNSLEDDTCLHSVRGGVLAWLLVKYVTYMLFYSVYEMCYKIGKVCCQLTGSSDFTLKFS